MRRRWPPGWIALGACLAIVVAAVGPFVIWRGGSLARFGTSGQGGFGRLPVAHLAPPDESMAAAPGQPIPYFGPARLSLATELPDLPAVLPVWRFSLADTAMLEKAARAHGGRAVVPGPANFREPMVFINLGPPSSIGGTAPPARLAEPTADDFLRQRGLLPAWPYLQSTVALGPLAVVRYQRSFAADRSRSALQVDAHGAPAGALVVVSAQGAVVQATLPLDVPLQVTRYRARPAAALAAEALASPPVTAAGPDPEPEVRLTSARLVYLAVPGRTQGYFEPALLLTGEFSAGQSRFEKRVLVPAIDPDGWVG